MICWGILSLSTGDCRGNYCVSADHWGGAGDHGLPARHGEGHDRGGHHQQGREDRLEGKKYS